MRQAGGWTVASLSRGPLVTRCSESEAGRRQGSEPESGESGTTLQVLLRSRHDHVALCGGTTPTLAPTPAAGRGVKRHRHAEQRALLAADRKQKYGESSRVLNVRAVRPITEVRYRKLIQDSGHFLQLSHGLRLSDLAAGPVLDKHLADYTNALFLEGEACHVGSATLAAVGWLWPEVSRFGKTPLPLTKQALAGFRHVAPSKARLAVPESVMMALNVTMAEMGHLRCARTVFVGVALYLRPGEMCGLTVGQLIAPMQGALTPHWTVVLHPEELNIASQTGQYNDLLVLDGVYAATLAKVCEKLCAQRQPSDKVIGIDQAQYAEVFRTAVHRLGVQVLNLVPYQARHAGASCDLLANRRTLADVKRRGRWMADKSMNRYLKGGRAAEQLRRLAPEVRERCLQKTALVCAILSGNCYLRPGCRRAVVRHLSP